MVCCISFLSKIPSPPGTWAEHFIFSVVSEKIKCPNSGFLHIFSYPLLSTAANSNSLNGRYSFVRQLLPSSLKKVLKKGKCTNSYHLTNILFRKDNLQRRIRTMNHEVNFLKNYRKNIKNNYIFVFNSKTN